MGDIFSWRPSAPSRAVGQETAGGAGGGRKESGGHSMNTLSLGNWLSSLPDNKAEEGAGEGRKRAGGEPAELSLAELDDLELGGGCIGQYVTASCPLFMCTFKCD